MIRHFTATGFVVHQDATLLHWHQKVQEWLPPGGHVEPNEDLVQATLREIKEETGLNTEIVPTQPVPDISNLELVAAPYAVMIEDVIDDVHGEHQHIDHIYFARVTGDPGDLPGSVEKRPDAPDGWRWVTLSELQAETAFPIPSGEEKPPPEDVLKLGEAAIRFVSGE